MPKNEENHDGRYTKWKPEYNNLVYQFCLLGAIDEQIAEFFDVSVQTLNNWKKECGGFLESMRKGKILADAQMANTLFDVGMGYKDEGGVYHSPNGSMAVKWLELRQRGKWGQKIEIKTDQVIRVLPAPDEVPKEGEHDEEMGN